MKFEEMRKIAAARKPGKWEPDVITNSDFYIFHSAMVPTYSHTLDDHNDAESRGSPKERAMKDAEFIAMAANNWDELMDLVDTQQKKINQLMAVVDAAEGLINTIEMDIRLREIRHYKPEEWAALEHALKVLEVE